MLEPAPTLKKLFYEMCINFHVCVVILHPLLYMES